MGKQQNSKSEHTKTLKGPENEKKTLARKNIEEK